MRASYPAPVDHRSSDAEVFAAARRVEPLYAGIMGDSWFQLGGERITHAVMGILYGRDDREPGSGADDLGIVTHRSRRPAGRCSGRVAMGLVLMAVGVLASGLRDLYAAYELPHGSWPW